MKADLIEIHVTFARPKDEAHLEVIAAHVVDAIHANFRRHFATQRPNVYVADIRGGETEEDE